MNPPGLLAQSLAPVVDLVFPPRCPACGEGLGAQEGLCGACWQSLVIPGEPCCAACQRPLASADSGPPTLCGPCLADPPRHAGIAAATLYGETSRKLVLAFKHGGRIALAPMLARMIAARLPEPTSGQVIVPVPLHRWRLWQRGYNQAALLASELAKLGHGRLCLEGLVRRKATRSLGGLGRKARLRALSGAITTNPGELAQLRGSEILLVDDVLTSGATVGACVAALRRAGSGPVRIACFARVLDEAEVPRQRSRNETPEV